MGRTRAALSDREA
jgi:hypothetical protein